MDAEGDELEVLLGVQSWDKIEQVVLEVHHVQGRVRAVEELLQRQNFLVVVGDSLGPSTSIVYAAKEDRLLNGR